MSKEKIVSILAHDLVPKHIILKEDEIKKILKKYNITKKQLPKILNTDSVIKELDANEGDIIMIERKSVVAGKVIYYRIVSKKVAK